uniref:SAS-6_N domain-containing protein n=1 Tax=Trichuris muris TaxID=70415 RepID=A0A5S6R0R0_TRIMR
MTDRAVANVATHPNELNDVPLYAKKLPLSFVQNGQKLKVNANFKLFKSTLPTTEHLLQKLFIKLTRDDDPLLLLTTTILQEDYHRMKESQNLLVDFQSFSQKLIDLLELVLFEAEKTEPRFVIELQLTKSGTAELSESDNAILEVVEVNRFRRLTHLFLELQFAPTEQLQKHLCSLVIGLTKERAGLQKQLFQLDEELKKEKKKEEETVRRHESQLESARNRHLKSVAELQARHEEEKAKLENTISKINLDFQAECDQLRTSLSELEAARTECATISSENIELRQEIDGARREVVEAEKIVNQLQSRLCGAEQEILEKESIIFESEERLENAFATLKRTEETVAKQAAIITQLQTKYADQVDETQKGIHILRRFKDEIMINHRKASLRARIALEQEKKVEQYELEIKEMKKKMESLKEENNQLNEQVNRNSKEMDDLRKSLNDVMAQMEGKEKIICYLNKRIRSPLPHGALGTTPCDLPYKPVLNVVPTDLLGATVIQSGLDKTTDASGSKLDPKYLLPNLPPLLSNLHIDDQNAQER